MILVDCFLGLAGFIGYLILSMLFSDCYMQPDRKNDGLALLKGLLSVAFLLMLACAMVGWHWAFGGSAFLGFVGFILRVLNGPPGPPPSRRRRRR